MPISNALFSVARTVGLALGLLLFADSALSQQVALTFDDGPDMSNQIYLSPAVRNAAILRQLANAHLKSTLFVTRTDSDPKRNELIRQWGIQGHQIGNHTATHPNFDEVSLAEFEQELLRCETAIQRNARIHALVQISISERGRHRRKARWFQGFPGRAWL